MNSNTAHTIMSRIAAGLVFGFFLATTVVSFSSTAHAQAIGDYYDTSCCGDYYDTSFSGGDYYDTSFTGGNYYDTSYPTGGSYYDTFYPTTGGGSYYDTFSPTGGSYYDTFTPTYTSGGYTIPSYTSGTGYTIPNYTYPTPHYSTPTMPYIPYPTPSYPTTPSNTNVVNSGNTNVMPCAAPNTCNTTTTSTYTDNSIYNPQTTIVTDSHNTTVTNPAPVIINNNNATPTAPAVAAPVYYQPAYTPPPVFYPAPQPQPVVARQTTPYVTLSAVPYTGLELGPMGTAMYWSFLVLWSLFAAYLIAVKKVHYKIAQSAKNFLFGTSAHAAAAPVAAAHREPEAPAHHAHAVHRAVQQEKTPVNGIDEFIFSQIHRKAA